jgi:hypothetical protein
MGKTWASGNEADLYSTLVGALEARTASILLQTSRQYEAIG